MYSMMFNVMISDKMRTLKFLLYKYENKPAFRKAVLNEILWALSYSILGYVFHHCLDPSFLVAQWLERWCTGIVTQVQFLRISLIVR